MYAFSKFKCYSCSYGKRGAQGGHEEGDLDQGLRGLSNHNNNNNDNDNNKDNVHTYYYPLQDLRCEDSNVDLNKTNIT